MAAIKIGEIEGEGALALPAGRISALEKAGYAFVGSHKHSAVKVCFWVKNSLTGTGTCYKNKFYEVIGVAHRSETLEELVVYRALWDSPEFGYNALWVRPKKIFLETVEVDGKKVPRFEYVGPKETNYNSLRHLSATGISWAKPRRQIFFKNSAAVTI